MEKIKNNKGITLVMLVVTIIVLLILAGISISAITGGDSSMDKAKKAKDETAIKAEMEELQKIINQSAAKGIRHGNFSGSADSQTIRDALKKNKLINEDPDQVIIDGQSVFDVTGAKTGQNYAITSNGEVIRTCSAQIGDSINYSTTRNEITLDNWKVFYKEIKNGTEYVYLIYGDYLPYDAIGDINGLQKGGEYTVKGTTKSVLINGMTEKSNWNDLLQGNLNGIEIDYSNSTDNNIYGMATPTVDLWVNSWNKLYSNDLLYCKYTDNVDNNNYEGWYISTTSPITTMSVNLFRNLGHSNTLYFPHTAKWNGCLGYWLASPSAEDSRYILMVAFDGTINGYFSILSNRSFRPVICLPSSVLD